MTHRGPVDLLDAVPRALGRDPLEEVVMVGVSDAAPDAALVYCISADLDPDEVAVMAADAVAGVVRDGARAVAIAVYGDSLDDWSRAAQIAAALYVRAEGTLRVLDVVAVADNRWRSFLCSDLSCCPREGAPLPEESSTP